MFPVDEMYYSVFQDSINALVLDLDYPALRKNKNIETFLIRCEYFLCADGNKRPSPPFSKLNVIVTISLMET